jgi:hypothetical protein
MHINLPVSHSDSNGDSYEANKAAYIGQDIPFSFSFIFGLQTLELEEKVVSNV